MPNVAILGPGRAGGALAIAFDRAGLHVRELIYHRHPVQLPCEGTKLTSLDSLTRIDSDVLIVATPDPKIRSTAEKISTLGSLPKTALHISGSLPSAELQPLRQKGVAVGSMHPLVSISDPITGAKRFAGSYFCIEGDEAAVVIAKELVAPLGGIAFSIDTKFKPLYHAAAVMASGNVTALFDAAVEMLSNCGLERERAHSCLLPLLNSSIANLAEGSTLDALTGPFIRGDVEAFKRHLTAIDALGDANVREIYLALAERAARLAGSERSVEILNSISIAKRKTEC